MYFETGQGSALSANANHGLDQQTCEARAYAVARKFNPLLVNTVVGFIGPEYLYDGKQIIRAGLEDHFCGKLLGLPMGCDICYTNHAEADQDDMDSLLTLLGVAGVNYIMGVPGADDVMLNYQSTSFHDSLYIRNVLGLKRAPEFEAWLERMSITDNAGRLSDGSNRSAIITPRRTAAERIMNDRKQGSSIVRTGTTFRFVISTGAQRSGRDLRCQLSAAREQSLRSESTPQPLAQLRRFTPARIALGRTGNSLPDQRTT